jgi:hypothetical protein
MVSVDFERRNLYATVELFEAENGGFSSEWWVSGKYGDDLLIIGHLEFPVYGFTQGDVSKRLEYLRDPVFDFLEQSFGGNANIHAFPSPEKRISLLMDHVNHHWSSVKLPEDEKMVLFYNFVTQFRVKNPAVVLSVLFSTPVRTIHDKLASFRSLGLVPEVGQGRSY